MNKIYLVSFFLLFIGYSCSEETIQYTDFNQPTQKTLKGQLLNQEFLFSFPAEMVIIDSLLIIHDSFNTDSSFHVFNKNTGQHTLSFGIKGRGPGEVIYPSSLNYSHKTKLLTTYEPNLKKVIRYNIDNIISHTKPYFSEIQLTNMPNDAVQAIPLGNKLLLRGYSPMRFGITNDKNEIDCIYKEYPDIVADKEINHAIFNYMPQIALNPDEDKMVSLTYIGGILEIFHLSSDSIVPEVTKFFNKPVYKELKGFKPKAIATIPATVKGCANLYTTNDYIYTIYEGELPTDSVELKKINVFDWQGDAVIQYKLLEGFPQTIASDKDYLYSIILNRNYEYQLYRYAYKD